MHYVDFDLYGTVNFTNNIGAQIGYRSLDVGYVVDTDTGAFKLKGIYFGVVARYETQDATDGGRWLKTAYGTPRTRRKTPIGLP